MYCPVCGSEYIAGVTECEDCGVALQSQPPEPRASDPADREDLDLVPLLETGDAGRVALVKSLLDNAEIPFLARNDQLQDLFGIGRLVPVNPISGPVFFMVRREDEAAAREMLAAYEEPET